MLPHKVAFHLGLHCLPKYPFTGIQYQNEKVKYSKTCVKQPLSKRPKLVFKTKYCLMQVKSVAECSKGSILILLQGEHSAMLSTFIKLPIVKKIFGLSIFEWLF